MVKLSNLRVLYIGENGKRFLKASKKYTFNLEYVKCSMQALKLLKNEKKYSLIICEFEIAGNNGLFFYETLQKENLINAIPFILVTKIFDRSTYLKAFEMKLTDYFVLQENTTEDILKRVNSLFYKSKKKITTKNNLNSVRNSKVYKLPLSKRICDVIFSIILLVLLSPILIIVIIAIKLESRGKFYYITKRVGRKTFNFYKLRSMRTGSDSLLQKLSKKKNIYNKNRKIEKPNDECPRCKKLKGNNSCSAILYINEKKICEYWNNINRIRTLNQKSTFIKIPNDPRVTIVGKFIRNTSIDELPQLINVLKGDMSIVGNRPLPLYEAELLTNDHMSKRFLAPAGITGLWQVELRGKKGNMSEEDRIKLDNIYSEYFTDNNYSLWFDLKIIFKTIPALFQKASV
ncbi:sugar transferase [Tenacibaculum sp. C7A-26P2]|uniref:sugar transferase n=1 Tax=Tenacibaculum sp. C7A-26P2 TaxID=3447504 RepID=UPI003F83DDAB